jgi:hypothetical protein
LEFRCNFAAIISGRIFASAILSSAYTGTCSNANHLINAQEALYRGLLEIRCGWSSFIAIFYSLC